MKNKAIPLILFSIAMGLLEAVVVVYLRLLYYPDGFTFPLAMMSEDVYRIELMRELATLVMLATVSIAAGRKFYERLAYFLLTFAVWDVFYYVFLKLLLNWPASLLDWDILFLIPITWLGPVLAPLLCTLVMLAMAGLILHYDRLDRLLAYTWYEWTCILGGSFVIFLTFINDYAGLLEESGLLARQPSPHAGVYFQNMASQFVPKDFLWLWFGIGLAIILAGVASWLARTIKTNR